MNSFVSSCHHAPTVLLRETPFSISTFHCAECREQCYLVAPLWLDRDELKLVGLILHKAKGNLSRPDIAQDIEAKILNLLTEASQ